MSEKSRTEHIKELSKELLDDIELNRLDAERLLLKTMRLARYTGVEEIKTWLSYEMLGYKEIDEVGYKYLDIVGRWSDKKEKKGFFMPLSQIESTIKVEKAKLKKMSIPDTSGEWANVAIRNAISSMNRTSNRISKLGGIKSRVLAKLHNFISEIYYEKVFETFSESIFESYKKDINYLITEKCGDIIEKIPFVLDRLAEGNEESISQALNTCRRIIDNFADEIFPPRDETFKIGNNELSLKNDKSLNRINVYVYQNCNSKSRQKKIGQNLSNLYSRLSAGVHDEISVEEARSLFLNTYLILGEVLTLEEN
ncbi:hypothetical protein [Natroniella sp. ANB-PHB2]|uniref:AbiTii domain-containing protein n=1 Tax=Natroniella sp. ANB-PHB2 TaxID=3384444 RepID=UPI0038D39680